MSSYDPDRHHRRSIRLKDWDYSEAGAYFVTIVTYQRAMLFGEIVAGALTLSPGGEIVKQEWLKSEVIRKEITLDEFIVMPNHLHAIVWINNPPEFASKETERSSNDLICIIPRSLGSMMIGFKSSATSRLNRMRNTPGCSVWQRSYHDHIIRNAQELQAIRAYIQNNPLNWQLDAENPNRLYRGAKHTPTQ